MEEQSRSVGIALMVDICEEANKSCTVAEALVDPKQNFSFQSSFKVYQLVRLPLTKLVDTTSYVHRY